MELADIITLTDAGHYDRARKQLETHDLKPLSQYNFLLVEIYLLLNEVDQAEQLIDDMLSLDPDPYEEMLLTTLSAVTYWFNGDVPKARDVLDDAFDMHTPSMENKPYHHYWLSFMYNTSGILNILLGRSDEGKTEFETAYPLAKQSNSGRRVAAALDNLGIAQRYLGNYDAAIVYQNRVLKLRLELGDTHGIAITKGNLGELYEITGELEKSLTSTRESLELFKEVGTPEEIGQCHHNLGRLYYEHNQLEAAFNQFKQALDYRQPLGNPTNTAMVLYYLVIITLELDRKEVASNYLDQLKEEFNEDDTVVKLYYYLARALYIMVDDPDQINTTVQLLERVIELNDYDIELTYIAYISKISILFDQVDTIDDNQLLESLSELKKLAHQKQNILVQTELYLLKSKIDLLTGNINSAIDQLDNAENLAQENNYQRIQEKINYHRQVLIEFVQNPDLETTKSDQTEIKRYLTNLVRRFHRSYE